MTPEMLTATKEKIEHLIEHQNYAGLEVELAGLHPADIANAFRQLSPEQRIACFDVLEPETAGEVVESLDFDLMVDTMARIDTDKLVQILQLMPSDAAVDVLNEFPDERVYELIRKMPDLKQASNLKELLSYPEDTAGGLMSSEFVKIYADMTAEETLNYLRIKAERETTSFYYLYVVDRHDHLVGVLGLRTLITTPVYMTVEQIMNPEVISVNHYDDQSVVAERIQKYQLLAIPVVDNAGRLKGIVTWDDAADVLEEELTDEFYTSSGLSTEEFYTEELLAGKLITAVKSRTPWLLVTMLGSFVAVLVGDAFGHTLHAVPLLAIFIPLLGGLGGNVGTQSSALIVRGLATGHVTLERAVFHVIKQFAVGSLIGIIIGVLVGTVVGLWKGNPWFGVIIGGGLLGNITVAATLGTLVPFLFKRINIDPAIASGPFITTAIDITGLSIYFGLATMALKHLH